MGVFIVGMVELSIPRMPVPCNSNCADVATLGSLGVLFQSLLIEAGNAQGGVALDIVGCQQLYSGDADEEINENAAEEAALEAFTDFKPN
jgi:hypothetical protein